jgi:hypothetical protein
MKIEQFQWKAESGWQPALPVAARPEFQLALVFLSTTLLKENGPV